MGKSKRSLHRVFHFHGRGQAAEDYEISIPERSGSVADVGKVEVCSRSLCAVIFPPNLSRTSVTWTITLNVVGR